MLFLISLNWTWERRRDTLRYSILLFLSARAKILARADLLLSPLPLCTCEDNCPFSQKATSIHWTNPGRNFPPIEETLIFFLSGRESKICWYQKIYLFDLSWSWTQNQTSWQPGPFTQWSDISRKRKIFFPPFFYFTRVGPPTLKSGQTDRQTDTHTHTLLVQLHIQHDRKKCSLLHRVTNIYLYVK